MISGKRKVHTNLLNNPSQTWRESFNGYFKKYKIILTDHFPSVRAAAHVNIERL